VDPAILLPVAVFLGVLAVAYAVSTMAGRSNATIRRRLDGHAVPIEVAAARRRARLNLLKEPTYSSVAAVNAVLRRLRPARTAVGELLRADSRLSVAQYLAVRAAVAGVGFLAVRVVAGNAFVALAAGLVGVMAPRVTLIVIARRRRTAFEAQLAEAIDLLVGALRSGHGFLQGIESVSKEMGDPMRAELVRVIEQVNVGVDPLDALQLMTERIISYDLALFVSAISVQRQTGGNLAEVLGNLADTVRERRRIRGEVRALTTGPRVSGYILGVVPIALLIYFLLVSEPHREMMADTLFGRVLFGVATVWSMIGLFLSQKVAKVEY
jgi:tight adherence protein B